MTEEHTLMNALVGAAVTVVFAFLPFSAVLGGVISGYLQGGEYGDGARAGALSGLVASVPLALLGLLLAGFFVIVPVTSAPSSLLFLALVVLVAVGSFVGIYLVGAGALGGMMGAYLAAELSTDTDG